MKNTILFSSIFTMLSCSGLIAQETNEQTEQQKIKKEVQVTEDNGVKTVTIVTDVNGTVTTETYTGEEADKKLNEMASSEEADAQKQERRVMFEEVDGKKVLTVKTTVKGEEKIEVYEGDEAETKLKEIQSEESGSEQKVQKKIIKEEVKKEKADM